MQTTCENCFTVYDPPEQNRGPAACPYCEHVNKPKKSRPADPNAGEGLKVDSSKTMLTYMEGERKDEVSAVQKTIQGKVPFLPADQKLILTLLQGKEKGKSFLLGKPVIRIGRKEADLILKDPEISRQHCVIQIYGETVIIRDLRSANGTWVNGLAIKEDSLKNEDQLRIGNSILRLSIQPKNEG